MKPIIEAKFKLLTPAYCGNGDQKPAIRPLSLRGILRFHFRAVAWASEQVGENLAKLKELENRLFGSAGNGTGLISLRITDIQSKPTSDCPQTYLAYGVHEANRSAIAPDSEFTLKLISRKVLSEPEIALLQQTVASIAVCGGLGARSRKGYGSLQLKELSVKGQNKTLEWTSLIESLASISAKSQPPFAAWGRHKVWFFHANAATPETALKRLGSNYQLFRAFGRDGMVGNMRSLRKFENDHDTVREYLVSGKQKSPNHIRRSAFGLPLPFFFSSIKSGPNKATVTGEVFKGEKESFERRASPLHMKIAQNFDGKGAFVVLTLFESAFFPSDHLRTQIDGKKTMPLPSSKELYAPIHEFADFLKSGEAATKFELKGSW